MGGLANTDSALSGAPDRRHPREPVEPRRHPTARATQLSLTALAGWVTATGLVWLGGWIALAPPETVPGPWLSFAVMAVSVAVPCVVVALRPDLRGSRWVPLGCTALALLGLAKVNADTGLVGWWKAMELATMLALAACIALPLMAATASIVAVLALAGTLLARATFASSILASSAAMVSAGARLLVAAIAVLLGSALLRRASAATDRLLLQQSGQREQLDSEERRRRTDRQARRFLHDSGMNSLEAINRGVPAAAVTALRERCATDADRWLRATAAPADDAAAAFRPALQEAQLRGLDVTTEFSVEGALPDVALGALAEASGEALRNSAKHSHAETAALQVTVAQGTATVEISDDGGGFDPTTRASGFGLDGSIRRRMADAGGAATIESSPGGGTTVTLTWPDAAGADVAEEPSATADEALDLPSLLARISWWPIGLVAIGAVASAIVNWYSVERPWLLAVTGLVLAGACSRIARRWGRGRMDSFDVALVCSCLVIATLALPVADPFCSAASGPALIPDGRLLVLALLGVAVASWRVSLLALTVTLAALALAGLMWNMLWPMCAGETIPTGIGLALISAAGWQFGRAVRRQERSARCVFAQSEETRLELARSRADELVRAEWEVAAVADVRDLLRLVADPATDLDDPELRRTAGASASRLRAAVRAKELPGALGTALTALVERGREYGFPVTVEGDLGDPQPIEEVAIREATTAFEYWLPGVVDGATAAQVTLSSFGGVRSALVCVAGGRPGMEGSAPDLPKDSSAQVEVWTDGAGAWWQAEWPATTKMPVG